MACAGQKIADTAAAARDAVTGTAEDAKNKVQGSVRAALPTRASPFMHGVFAYVDNFFREATLLLL